MRKVVYWKSLASTGEDGLSIRTRTKRECNARRKEFDEGDYEPCKKVIVPYKDAFDLVQRLCGEFGCRNAEYSEREWDE